MQPQTCRTRATVIKECDRPLVWICPIESIGYVKNTAVGFALSVADNQCASCCRVVQRFAVQGQIVLSDRTGFRRNRCRRPGRSGRSGLLLRLRVESRKRADHAKGQHGCRNSSHPKTTFHSVLQKHCSPQAKAIPDAGQRKCDNTVIERNEISTEERT